MKVLFTVLILSLTTIAFSQETKEKEVNKLGAIEYAASTAATGYATYRVDKSINKIIDTGISGKVSSSLIAKKFSAKDIKNAVKTVRTGDKVIITYDISVAERARRIADLEAKAIVQTNKAAELRKSYKGKLLVDNQKALDAEFKALAYTNKAEALKGKSAFQKIYKVKASNTEMITKKLQEIKKNGGKVYAFQRFSKATQRKLLFKQSMGAVTLMLTLSTGAKVIYDVMDLELDEGMTMRSMNRLLGKNTETKLNDSEVATNSSTRD